MKPKYPIYIISNRFHKKRIYAESGAIFRAAEDFVDRFTNVPMAGFEYSMFRPDNTKRKPYGVNRRVYSCILLSNRTSFRWRGRYNEDTDLSLRFLKAGFCTILFYQFLCDKIASMRMKGGNTDELYKNTAEMNGRLEMAKSLKAQHPEITEIVWKYNRWHHKVDYSKFRKDYVPISGVNNYGMELVVRG